MAVSVDPVWQNYANYSQVALAALSCITLIVLCFYALDTRRIRMYTQKQYESSYVPILFVESFKTNCEHVTISVRNAGKGPAFNVRFSEMQIRNEHLPKCKQHLRPIGFIEPNNTATTSSKLKILDENYPLSHEQFGYRMRDLPFAYGESRVVKTYYTDQAGQRHRSLTKITFEQREDVRKAQTRFLKAQLKGRKRNWFDRQIGYS